MCFFTRENIHGSGRPKVTDKARVSMDFRIAEGIYGDLLGRKIPAGRRIVLGDGAHPCIEIGNVGLQSAALQRLQQSHALRLLNDLRRAVGQLAHRIARGMFLAQNTGGRVDALDGLGHEPCLPNCS